MKGTINLFFYIFVIIFFSNMGCVRNYSPEEKLQAEKEKKRIEDCVRSINFIDEHSIKKSHRIVDLVVITTWGSGKTEYAFDYLKRTACEKKGDALITPAIQVGPIRTTYISKIISWSPSEDQ